MSYDPASNDWTGLNFFHGTRHMVTYTPGLGFVPLTLTSARPMVWFNRGEHLYRPGYQPFPLARWHEPFTPIRAYQPYPSTAPLRESFATNYDNTGPNGVGITLYYDERSVRPALRGVQMAKSKETCCDSNGQTLPPDQWEYTLTVFPYADGALDWPLRDYSDWKLMRVGLCRGLHGCGTAPGEPGAECEGRCNGAEWPFAPPLAYPED